MMHVSLALKKMPFLLPPSFFYRDHCFLLIRISAAIVGVRDLHNIYSSDLDED
jgi:hypothetical protein